MLAFNLSDIITVPFGYLMSWLYDLTSNYGVALILFAVIVKLVLFPISAKSKKSTMKMSRLTPRVQEIRRNTPMTLRSRTRPFRPSIKRKTPA